MKKDISQDLTQNLFYRIIKYKNTFNNEYGFKCWIYQMARNLFKDYYKEEKRSEDLFYKTESYPYEVIEESNSFMEEDFERLEIALSYLRTDQKEIILLSRFQGLKYEEISVITNQSIPAIKVAMHRAIKQLRSIYFKQIKD